MIKISPENPTSGDPIVITVSGNASVCKIEDHIKLIDSNPVFIAEVDDIFDCSFTGGAPYNYNFQLGSLVSGQYTIIHRVNNTITNTESFTEQIIVNVSEAAVSIPQTNVPSSGLLSLLMLTIALLVTGKYFLKPKK